MRRHTIILGLSILCNIMWFPILTPIVLIQDTYGEIKCLDGFKEGSWLGEGVLENLEALGIDLKSPL